MLKPIEIPNGKNVVENAQHTLLGFGFVVLLLLVVGLTAWQSVDKLFTAVERYSSAGQLLIALDRARLHELSFTRDNSLVEAAETKKYINRSITLAHEFHNKRLDSSDKTATLVQVIKSYQVGFDKYDVLSKQKRDAYRSMEVKARDASASADALQNLQTEYINKDRKKIIALRDKMQKDSIDAKRIHDLSIAIKRARGHGKDYLLFRNDKDFVSAKKELTGIEQHIKVLSTNLTEGNSRLLLARLINAKTQYENTLYGLRRLFPDADINFGSEHRMLRGFSKVSSDLAQIADEMIYHTDHLLSIYQADVSHLQGIMANRLILSGKVTILTQQVSAARQGDKDFFLSYSTEDKKTYSNQVISLLAVALDQSKKIKKF